MPLADMLNGLGRLGLASWPSRWTRAGKRAGSPRILVFGNCQCERVARAMALLLPDASVTYESVFQAPKRLPRFTDLVAFTRKFDIVFSGTFMPPFRGGGDLAAFRQEVAVRLVPTIVFAAFHPDQVMVGRLETLLGKGLVVGPLGHAHSAIALFGYLEGLSLAETERLFQAEVYRRVSYFDAWDGSVAALHELGREAGYDLAPDLVRWARRGCFMHCDNHPKVFVMADLARALLTREGIRFEDCDLDAYLADDMQNVGSYPVYPEIGEHYGVRGSALFFKAATRASGPARTMRRSEFLAATFERYRQTPRDNLYNARVEGWQADATARADLLAIARPG